NNEVYLFFFLQAEVVIRDFHVTGVQTCALPISEVLLKRVGHGGSGCIAPPEVARPQPGPWVRCAPYASPRRPLPPGGPRHGGGRSEERRGGKDMKWRNTDAHTHTTQRP